MIKFKIQIKILIFTNTHLTLKLNSIKISFILKGNIVYPTRIHVDQLAMSVQLRKLT